MAFDEKLAARIREALQHLPLVEEKKMFRGVTFMVNQKMCINVSGKRLMCRFDPAIQDQIAQRPGYEEMVMKGKPYRGFCYVNEPGFRLKKDFLFWVDLCLQFNEKAKSSKAQKKSG